MSYLLKKLNEIEDFNPESVKKMLFREGFVDIRLDMKYEIYSFYQERLKYYQRRRINQPKTQARYETQKAYNVSKHIIYQALELFD